MTEMISDVVRAVQAFGTGVNYISVSITSGRCIVVYVMADSEDDTRRLAEQLGAPQPVAHVYQGMLWWNSNLGQYGDPLMLSINGGHRSLAEVK